MKFVLSFVVTAIAASSAFAGSKYCLDAKLTSNSHPSIACPGVTKICVKNLNIEKETAKSLILVDGNKKTLELPFSSYDKVDNCDISSHLIASFYDNGVYGSYEVESDEYYTNPKRTGTFKTLALHTGKKSNDNSVHYSQLCIYEVIKK